MRSRTIQNLIGLLAVAAISSLIGCSGGQSTAGKPAATDQRVYFPPPPAPPRLQFLTSFKDAEPWASKRKKETNFTEWLVGTEKAGTDASTHFEGPYGMAVHNGRFYICDVARDRVHVIDTATGVYSLLGTRETIKNPVNITIDADGTKYVCDSGRRMVLVYDAQDQFVSEFGRPDQWTPLDLAIGANEELYVCDVTGGEIEVWTRQGQFLRTIGTKGDAPDQLRNPTNLDIGPDGRIHVVDSFLRCVKIFDPQGTFVDVIGGPGEVLGGFARPKGIAIDPHGVVFVADTQYNVIQAFTPEGKLLLVFGKSVKEPYGLGMPAGLLIDKSSIDIFRKFVAPTFAPEYLLFVVNQFGKNKIAVFAYGRDTTLQPERYEIDPEAVEKARVRATAIEKGREEGGAKEGGQAAPAEDGEE